MSDKLVELVDRHLKKRSSPTQTHEELIFDVVADYIHHLMSIGNVPHWSLDRLENYLSEEVIEIYRKKTYGFMSLADFRKAKSKSKSNQKA